MKVVRPPTAPPQTYFSEALRIGADSGILVCHETHRGRILYNPWCVVLCSLSSPLCVCVYVCVCVCVWYASHRGCIL